jgi:NitT/TauT family transport system substrate-binding protein
MKRQKITLLAALLAVACATPSSPTRPAASAATPGSAGAAPGDAALAPPAPRQRLTIPFTQASSSYGALFTAHDGGFWERQGLDVEMINLGAGQVAQAALVSGEVVVTGSGGPGAVNAIAAGANVIVVGVVFDTLPFQLIAVREYASIPELRGTTIGINRLGGSPHVVLRYMMRQGGVNVDQEARVIQIGQQPERIAALRSGAIQATILIPPLGTIVEREGLRILGDSASLGLAYPSSVLVMNRDWLRAERDTARRVLQGLWDGKRAFKYDKEIAVRALRKWLQIDDQALLEETHDYFSKVHEDAILPRPEGLQMVIDEVAEENPDVRILRPEDLVDPTLAAELR